MGSSQRYPLWAFVHVADGSFKDDHSGTSHPHALLQRDLALVPLRLGDNSPPLASGLGSVIACNQQSAAESVELCC